MFPCTHRYSALLRHPDLGTGVEEEKEEQEEKEEKKEKEEEEKEKEKTKDRSVPDGSDKKEIKRINTENIFPDDIAAPHIEGDEECEHGHKFSPSVDTTNIESTNMIIHHSQEAKDSRNSSLVLVYLRTEGGMCDCKKYFTGKNVVRLTLRCWGNSSIPEGRFSKWF